MEDDPGASASDPQGVGPEGDGETPCASPTPGSCGGLTPPRPRPAGVAGKIAAFSSGVAPVRSAGGAAVDEELQTVSEVLHKLEAACRATPRDSETSIELPCALVHSSLHHLTATLAEAARLGQELVELRNSRVQHLPPSAWVKREHKYKQDHEKFEHTVNMQRQRIAKLEAEVAVLREGASIRPLEEKIEELEQQLRNTAEEKVQVQSKFHELSIKHRQLIETSPQIASIWNEVLVEGGSAKDAAVMNRLNNFDLRHTGAGGALSTVAGGGGGGAGVVVTSALPGVGVVVGVTGEGLPAGPPAAPAARAARAEGQPSVLGGAANAIARAVRGGRRSPGAFKGTSDGDAGGKPSGAAAAEAEAAAGGGGAAAAGGGKLSEGQRVLQTAEERAAELMASVALEGLSPETQVAALQQLNYDLTMQLELYQQMVGRLKDRMEQADLEKAEIETDKIHLENQLAQVLGGASAHDAPNGSDGAAGTPAGARRWGSGLLSRWRGGGAFGGGDGEAHGGDDGMSRVGSPRVGDPLGADGAAPALPPLPPGDGAPVLLAPPTAYGRLFGRGKAAGAAPAAPGAEGGVEGLAKELAEAKRQAGALDSENKHLVNTLVEIKMELADVQGVNLQFKRALVRAMDKESCMEIRIQELQNMLDMVTSVPSAAAALASAQLHVRPGSVADTVSVADSDGDAAGDAGSQPASSIGRAADDGDCSGGEADGGDGDGARGGGGVRPPLSRLAAASAAADGADEAEAKAEAAGAEAAAAGGNVAVGGHAVEAEPAAAPAAEAGTEASAAPEEAGPAAEAEAAPTPAADAAAKAAPAEPVAAEAASAGAAAPAPVADSQAAPAAEAQAAPPEAEQLQESAPEQRAAAAPESAAQAPPAATVPPPVEAAQLAPAQGQQQPEQQPPEQQQEKEVA